MEEFWFANFYNPSILFSFALLCGDNKGYSESEFWRLNLLDIHDSDFQTNPKMKSFIKDETFLKYARNPGFHDPFPVNTETLRFL